MMPKKIVLHSCLYCADICCPFPSLESAVVSPDSWSVIRSKSRQLNEDTLRYFPENTKTGLSTCAESGGMMGTCKGFSMGLIGARSPKVSAPGYISPP